MFDFVEQSTFEAGNLLLAAGALRRQSPHDAQVLLRSGPRIFTRVTGFRGNAAEQDQDFDLDRIVCRLDSTLLFSRMNLFSHKGEGTSGGRV